MKDADNLMREFRGAFHDYKLIVKNLLCMTKREKSNNCPYPFPNKCHYNPSL